MAPSPAKPAAKKGTQQSARSNRVKASAGFTAEEKAAMRERAREAKAASRGTAANGESEVLAKIAEMTGSDRTMAERVHALMKATAPELSSRTWYGMPAYAKNGNVVCFFKNARKFKTRYATFGFSDKANLDDGAMWATEFALMDWTPDVEARIRALVSKAVS